MKNNKKYVGSANVFGTLYKVYLFDYDCEYAGLTKVKEKRIYIDSRLNEDDLLETLSHELFHAYFFECGLETYCDDEILIKCLGRWFLDINNKVAGLKYLIDKVGKNNGKKK